MKCVVQDLSASSLFVCTLQLPWIASQPVIFSHHASMVRGRHIAASIPTGATRVTYAASLHRCTPTLCGAHSGIPGWHQSWRWTWESVIILLVSSHPKASRTSTSGHCLTCRNYWSSMGGIVLDTRVIAHACPSAQLPPYEHEIFVIIGVNGTAITLADVTTALRSIPRDAFQQNRSYYWEFISLYSNRRFARIVCGVVRGR